MTRKGNHNWAMPISNKHVFLFKVWTHAGITLIVFEPLPEEPREYPHIPNIYRYYNFAADNMIIIISGVFSLDQIAHVGVSPSRSFKLIGREIIFWSYLAPFQRYCRFSVIDLFSVLMILSLSHPNFGGVVVATDHPCWGQPEQKP